VSDVVIDGERLRRRGIPEAVLANGKTPADLIAAFRGAHEAFGLAIATRLGVDQMTLLADEMAAEVDEAARMAWLGRPLAASAHRVTVVTAGAADARVAREAVCSLHLFGLGTALIADVGVAGIHRLLERLPTDHPDLYICVAGMDGALPAVLAGLVPRPVIGVPTSVGYGVAEGGRTALATMLASCAEGLAVMNIDNGYGAAAFAALALRR